MTRGSLFFGGLTAGRLGVELLLRKANGDRWGKSNQTRPMAETRESAKIEPPANSCTPTYLSHSHAVRGAGRCWSWRRTSAGDTRMVEKHYGHLSESYVAEAILGAAPRFGIDEPSNLCSRSRHQHSSKPPIARAICSASAGS